MDCHLQNLRTGEVVALDPHRTLIGTADHATIVTADGGPYLAAIAVEYPDGWVIHGLADDSRITLNRTPLRVSESAPIRPGDGLVIGEERFRFLMPRQVFPPSSVAPPSCFAYVQSPDGQEECRAVDHNLVFGRLAVCHVRFADTRLSRMNALLASHAGGWYVHVLSKKPIAQNRRLVETIAALEDGDELQIGPLLVRLEMRDSVADSAEPHSHPDRMGNIPQDQTPTDSDFDGSETADPFGPDPEPDRSAIHEAGLHLDLWLKARSPSATPGEGISSWLGAQRERLRRFWYDTPETTAARGLRASGKPEEAFRLLDKAIRARPDSPELLRELYRLYDAIGFHDLCYRPLRQIEKLAVLRGSPDTWVLETLARVCERLSKDRPTMFDRAINYWQKLESATGVSYARERAAASASRALHQGKFTQPTRELRDD